MEIRLQKFIRDVTGISRRDAEEYIKNGRVTVNGKRAEIGESVLPGKDRVELNGRQLYGRKEKIYLMLNKPAGYITSRYDPHNEETVFKLIPHEYKNLVPVGRLDLDTEGLLLLTNDGDLTNKLTHPKFEVEKEYFAVIEGKLNSEESAKIERGLKTKTIKTAPAKVRILKSQNNETSLNITLHEGQNREVRRIFGALGHPVLYLKRIRVAGLTLEELPSGQWRQLTPAEVYSLQQSIAF